MVLARRVRAHPAQASFIDSDPVFTQLAIAKAEPWYVEFFQRFDHLFTFGANIGTPACAVPVGDFHLAQDLAAGDARRLAHRPSPPGESFTTVMTWQIESFADVDGNKDQEFVKFIDLPSRTPQPFELAINGPQALLREHGWDTSTRWRVSRSPVGLPRLHPGLAGRVRRRQAHLRRQPLRLVQRSHRVLSGGGPPGAGAGHRLDRPPAAGDGLLAFSTPEEALAGLDRIDADYAAPRPARRRDRARALRRRPDPQLLDAVSA